MDKRDSHFCPQILLGSKKMENKTILIQGAMDIEIQALIEKNRRTRKNCHLRL